MNKYYVVSNCRTRANTNGLYDHFSDEQWEMVLLDSGNSCVCCGVSFDDVNPTADHILPLARGGSNTIDNIQPLCKRCNCSKHLKHVDYRKSAGALRGVVLLAEPPSIRKAKCTPEALMVRLPPELHAAVKSLADDERRSLNSQFIVLIEIGLKQLGRWEDVKHLSCK